MRDDAICNEETFVMVAALLIELSLYRKFMRCQSVETCVCFEKNIEFIFDTMDYSWVHPFLMSHPRFLASKHSAMPTPAKSGLPIKAALAVGKKFAKNQRIFKTSIFFQATSLPQPSYFPSSSSRGPDVFSG